MGSKVGYRYFFRSVTPPVVATRVWLLQRLGLLIAILLLQSGVPRAAESLRLATTTSTENTGLLEVLHPPFESGNNLRIDVIAVGTGKALRLARNGDVDVLMVHAPQAERAFVSEGFGIDRRAVMHNDFVLLGPDRDPAAVSRTDSPGAALAAIASSGAAFVSRGDDSGTHKKELALWSDAGLTPSGDWYLSVGQGMGAVLRIANDKNAYTLSDRGTWLAFRDKISLVPVFQGSPALYNPYHVIAVSPEVHPHTRSALARKYIDYVTGEQGQTLIRNFRKNGEVLFHPDAMDNP